MKKWTKIIGLLLVILFAYLYAHVSKTSALYENVDGSSTFVAVGQVEGMVEQEFVCPVKSLDGISVKCQVNGEGMTRMTLKDAETGEVIAHSEAAATDMKDGKYNKFSFEKIEEIKGKTVIVSFEPAVKPTEGPLVMKTVTTGFDVETFGMVLLIVAYIVLFFRFLCKLFSR